MEEERGVKTRGDEKIGAARREERKRKSAGKAKKQTSNKEEV